MAMTLNVNTGIQIVSGTAVFNWPNATTTVTASGSHVYQNSQDIPTTSSGTALVVGAGVATLGWALFLNLDATNFVDIGLQVSGTFYPLMRCPPFLAGKSPPAQLRITPGITLYARADTAICTLQYAIIEN